jgi:hypothetical protein
MTAFSQISGNPQVCSKLLSGRNEVEDEARRSEIQAFRDKKRPKCLAPAQLSGRICCTDVGWDVMSLVRVIGATCSVEYRGQIYRGRIE